MTTVYTTVNGQILHEKRDGVEAYYLPDTLGNVIATTSTTGTVRSTHTYWPYGEVRASTGTNHSPFKYVGTLGYYSDSATTLYVRARYYRPAQTRWMTRDPLWPAESSYVYADSMPVDHADVTGLSACWSGSCNKAGGLSGWLRCMGRCLAKCFATMLGNRLLNQLLACLLAAIVLCLGLPALLYRLCVNQVFRVCSRALGKAFSRRLLGSLLFAVFMCGLQCSKPCPDC